MKKAKNITYETKTCRICKEQVINARALLEHYREKHLDQLKRFDIFNKRKAQKVIWPATSYEEALDILGWKESDCILKRVRE